uniref:Leucine-rich repeat domain-containing protein n=1 Tax=uncultured bacterium contig00107 TaxID=1181573 RepID=A0A806K2F3_9BACT|nr:hypothetical protein [uncultured bacterium contig00107]
MAIPDGVTGIDDRAFYDCKNLESVTIPDSVTNMINSFDRCFKIVIRCGENSYAHKYAEENGIKFELAG